MDCKYQSGQGIRLISERDQLGVIVGDPQKLAGECWYKVNFGGGHISTVPESNLEPYEASRDLHSLLREGVFSNKETFSKLITFTKIKYPLKKNVYSFKASRTEFLEYQFKPVLKFLDSPNHRLLIADEVGLGKTIEAGYIISEQRARHPMDRVLIVCPSALTGKWKTEMESKFGEEFSVLKSSDVREFLKSIEQKGEAARLKGVCSLQTLRGRALLRDWEAVTPPLDLVVIDEAHHLRNPNTLSHRMGRTLSDSADALLFLTATPIHIGNENLFFLLRILNPEEFDNFSLFKSRLQTNQSVLQALRILRNTNPPDLEGCKLELQKVESTSESKRFLENPFYGEVLRKLDSTDSPGRHQLIEIQRELNSLNLLSHVLTRTRKGEVEERVQRQPRVVRVEMTNVEMDFYNVVTDYVTSKFEARGLGAFGAFISIMPQRQVASCIPAMVEHYARELSANDLGGLESEASDLAVEDWVENGSDGEMDEYEAEALASLRELILSKELVGLDSKFEALLGVLCELDKAEPNRKIIIFSYFKRTLENLSRKLKKKGYKNVVVSGDYVGEEREHRIEQFRDDPETRIMCSSEVGSEGLDFQFCHIMVNYDLPWNPMVVEQRIGRLDRIGQKSERIIIFNFSIPGTIEDRILNKLYMRIRIFEESLGDLEAILGEEIKSLTIDLLRSKLTPEEQEERITQAANAIEFRRQELENFEKSSAKFIGHDEFFLEEVDRIKKHKRYISPEELEVFLRDFLMKHLPKSLLESTEDEKIFEITINNDFIQFLRSKLPRNDVALSRFLPRAHQKKLPITFDSDTAFGNPNTELITIYHPIVRAMVRHYETHTDEMHPVAKIELVTDSFEENEYVYLVCLIEASAARPYRSLESVYVRMDSHDVLDDDDSEDLLFDMISSGDTLEHTPKISREAIDEAIGIASEVLGQRINKWKEDLKRTNEALVSNRLNSLEQSYQTKYEKKTELLRRAYEKESAPQYIRMLEGGLRNLTSDYEHKKSEIEKGRHVSLSFNEIAAGFLKVTNEH